MLAGYRLVSIADDGQSVDLERGALIAAGSTIVTFAACPALGGSRGAPTVLTAYLHQFCSAPYRAGVWLENERDGLLHDDTKKGGGRRRAC